MTPLDPNKKPVQNYPLTLTTLTPVCVKSHEEPLSPLADYVCEGDRIHFVNSSKFMAILQDTQNKELLGEYVKMVSNVNAQAEGKHDEFLNFLEKNNISISDISEESHPYSIQGNFTEISRHIRSAGKVYIPGSSLKGAIRNALFVDYCKKNEINIQSINSFLGLNKEETKISLKSTKGIQKMESFFNGRKENFLFNLNSLWGVEDSDFIASNSISVIQLNRKRLIDKEKEQDLENLSVLQEIIKPETAIQFNLFVKDNALDKIVSGKIENLYNKRQITPTTIFKALNQASKEFINFQKKQQHDYTQYYKEQLDYLEQLVECFSTNNQWALTCIGFGKSMLQNTVDIAVQKNWKDLNIEAPTTFFTVAQTGQTIGWCVIGTKKFTPEGVQIKKSKETINRPPVPSSSSEKSEPKNYNLTEISELKKGDDAIVKVKNILSIKPQKLIATTLFKGAERNITIISLDHTNYQEGDWIKVVLKDKSKQGEFKQAGFKEQLI